MASFFVICFTLYEYIVLWTLLGKKIHRIFSDYSLFRQLLKIFQEHFFEVIINFYRKFFPNSAAAIGGNTLLQQDYSFLQLGFIFSRKLRSFYRYVIRGSKEMARQMFRKQTHACRHVV